MTALGSGQGGDEEHLKIVSKRVPPPSQANDIIVFMAAAIAAVCGLVFGIVLLLDGPIAVYGGALAIGLFSLGIAVRRFFADRFPDIDAVEPRLEGPPVDEGALSEVAPVGRRPFLRRVLIAAGAIFGLGFLAPVTSLGPNPGTTLIRTAWRRGVRLVTTDAIPLRPEDVAAGGISTVWPEGAIGNELSAVVLIKLPAAFDPEPPTVLDWVVNDELIAYSKVCTHAGCPVGLYREQDGALFCPCHQSTFAAARGAIPTFGPTARALPQLPLGVDEEGFLIALDDFQAPVGPAFG